MASCPENSHCINTIGSYLCDCIDGSKQENNSCIEIKSEKFNDNQIQVKSEISKPKCESKLPKDQFIYCTFKNNCDKHSDCIYDTHKRKHMCKCWPGYIGNGYKCYGNLSKVYFQILFYSQFLF